MPRDTIAVTLDAYRPLAFRHKWMMQILVSFADEGGKCWPSLRTMKKLAGQSLSWVQRNLAEMRSLGYFTRARGKGSYVYQIAERFLSKWRRKESTPRDSQRTANQSPAFDRLSTAPQGAQESRSAGRKKDSEDSKKADAFLGATGAPSFFQKFREGKDERRQRRAGRQGFSPDWQPDPAGRQIAYDRGWSNERIADELANCRLHYTAVGRRIVNPGAAWELWVRRARDPARGFGDARPGQDRSGAAGVIAFWRKSRLARDPGNLG
jgi:hypothetical protein